MALQPMPPGVGSIPAGVSVMQHESRFDRRRRAQHEAHFSRRRRAVHARESLFSRFRYSFGPVEILLAAGFLLFLLFLAV
jgi:hypothetical protein